MSEEEAYNRYCSDFGKPPRSATQLLRFTQTKTDIKLTWKQANAIIQQKKPLQNDSVAPNKKVNSDSKLKAGDKVVSSGIERGSISHSKLRLVETKVKTESDYARREATEKDLELAQMMAARQARAEIEKTENEVRMEALKKDTDSKPISSGIQRGSISHSKLQSVETKVKTEADYAHREVTQKELELRKMTGERQVRVAKEKSEKEAILKKEAAERELQLAKAVSEREARQKKQTEEFEARMKALQEQKAKEFQERVEITKSEIETISQRRVERLSHWLNAATAESEQYIAETTQATEYTSAILSEQPSGDVGSKDTLIHVLASMSKANGKDCLFFNSAEGVTDSSGVSSAMFFNDMEQDSSSKLTLKLSNLAGLSSGGDEKQAESDLKSTVAELKTCVDLGQSHPILEEVISRLSNVHQCDIDEITITDVIYDGCLFEYTVTMTPEMKGEFDINGLNESLKDEFESFVEMRVHPLMFANRFDISDFDERGNALFDDSLKNDSYQIGPQNNQKTYTLPYGWVGYGLKVLDGRYGDDNTWLDPFQHSNNWYRAFHGTNVTVGKDILDEGFKPGSGQVYASSISPIDRRPIGVGVYCSPMPDEAELYATMTTIDTAKGRKTFYFMFQIAVDPTRVHQTDFEHYWVVRAADCGSAIRPYRILIKETELGIEWNETDGYCSVCHRHCGNPV